MFKKMLLVMVIGFVASNARAEDRKFYCDNVGGTEEWVIYVDLDRGLAGFFDNDSTAVVPLKQTLILESNPPQIVHSFEGEDRLGGEGDQLTISFNETRRTASVTLNLNGKQKTLKSLSGCVADPRVDLNE